MVKPGAGPPVVLNSEASPSLRPKVVSFNKSNCQAGLALEEEPGWFHGSLSGSLGSAPS